MKYLVPIAVLAIIAYCGPAMAFHDGGVAECQGCHTMHNSQDGALVDAAHPQGNAYLLNNGNSSDTCLRCHAGYGQFNGGFGYGAGGDFYWLTKTYTWSAHGHAASSEGDSHGHNIIAPAYSLAQDATLGSAPGGTFLSQYLTCTSCHDPHGNQNFRLLYGSTGDGPIYNGTRYNFTADAPLAVGGSRVTNVGSSGEETNESHTVYKTGFSDWCANCHNDMHAANTTNYVHPTGIALGSVAATYNAYVSSDNLTGGTQATAYLALVPYEDVDANLAALDSTNYEWGPEANDRVMCGTCHRAHASAFPDAGRWDFTETFLADSHPQATDGNATADDLANMYYNYTFVQNQRSLCNKCHAKDFGDAPY
jgi:hypothetical protein